MEHANHPAPPTFVRKRIFSVDHKVIGRQYLILGMLWALIGGLSAYIIRSQLAWPGKPVVGTSMLFDGGVVLPASYNALVTCTARSWCSPSRCPSSWGRSGISSCRS